MVGTQPVGQLEGLVLDVDGDDTRIAHRVEHLQVDVTEPADADDDRVVTWIQLPDGLLAGVVGGDASVRVGRDVHRIDTSRERYDSPLAR